MKKRTIRMLSIPPLPQKDRNNNIALTPFWRCAHRFPSVVGWEVDTIMGGVMDPSWQGVYSSIVRHSFFGWSFACSWVWRDSGEHCWLDRMMRPMRCTYVPPTFPTSGPGPSPPVCQAKPISAHPPTASELGFLLQLLFMFECENSIPLEYSDGTRPGWSSPS